MKQYIWRNIIISLAGLILPSVVMSHPYDEPLTFRKHMTSDGRVIYSNIEKRCFSDGALTCLEYHPIWKGSITKKRNANTDSKATSSVKPETQVENF